MFDPSSDCSPLTFILHEQRDRTITLVYSAAHNSSRNKSRIATLIISLLFGYRFCLTNSSSPSRKPSGTCTVSNLINFLYTSTQEKTLAMISALQFATIVFRSFSVFSISHRQSLDIDDSIIAIKKKSNPRVLPQYYPIFSEY